MGRGTMHVISRRPLRDFSLTHADAEGPLDAWFHIAQKAEWGSLTEVRGDFASADAVGDFTVFNIKGHSYRVITIIKYQSRIVFVRQVMTHAEYTRGRWKT